jgi:hypothetical protein
MILLRVQYGENDRLLIEDLIENSVRKSTQLARRQSPKRTL